MGQQQRIDEARRALRDLGFDSERSNERSALVLLALLDLSPNADWRQASAPMLRTVEIMDWLRRGYRKEYKPNTRETIRRQTLHQFVDAGLVVLNPDEPTRAINSPKNCYQVSPEALHVLARVGRKTYGRALDAYRKRQPGLVALYAREREQDLLPVTLLDGSRVELTPGGQNVLLKQMVEEFCPRWTPGGAVLYVGDAGKADRCSRRTPLAVLGSSWTSTASSLTSSSTWPIATGWCSWRLRRPTDRSTRSATASSVGCSALRQRASCS